MKKQINTKFLIVAIAAIFILGAFGSTFAQAKTGSLLAFFNLSSNANHNSLFNTTKEFDSTKIQPNNLFVANLESADVYPKPDFSGIEKWYEVVRYEYGDFEGGKNELDFWLKMKNDARPDFTAVYYDKDGVMVGGARWACFCEGSCYVNAPIGTVQKWSAGAPSETDMKKVTTVKVVRNEN